MSLFSLMKLGQSHLSFNDIRELMILSEIEAGSVADVVVRVTSRDAVGDRFLLGNET
jgi:hypothetical protein